ncbi:hypothetical protein [Aliivibrio fischeri]|uniref:hypothetical protein n=1 Tax=Aliivibrio fischeri TaxID=668 RepID=UPI0012DA039B|nr:hypothetical protein [Aliivibrio fischeri]MUJ22594.1 hypothetical protein [Aliivibrio fischeri]
MNNKLPSKYKPFKKVWVCNNIFNNGNILFEIDRNPVFLIGRGAKDTDTILWFRVPNNESGSRKWRDVISENKVNDSMFQLISSEYGNEVTFKGQPLLQFRIVGDKLIIDMVDFKSIGLNIYGGLSSLNIVGNSLTNNTFDHVNTMISIGE